MALWQEFWKQHGAALHEESVISGVEPLSMLPEALAPVAHDPRSVFLLLVPGVITGGTRNDDNNGPCIELERPPGKAVAGRKVRRAERWPVCLSAILPAILCLLAVGACVDEASELTVRAPPPPLETVAVAPAPPPPATPPPRPARKPVPPSTPVSLEPATSTPEATAPVEPAIPPEPPPAPDIFAQLDGRDQSSVADLLGEPQARDEAAPATIWRYVTHDCELDVYFYLDLKAKEMRALHYEVKSNDTSDRPQQCYAQLVADKRARLNTAGSPDRSR